MTIGYYTDNPLSKIVMKTLAETNSMEIKHIAFFDQTWPRKSVFYGMLRGCSRAMHILKHMNIDFHYIDNGYFDAHYIDRVGIKDMGGMLRVVKNGLHDVYPEQPTPGGVEGPNVLVLPPSPYSANFYDMTPEDWMQHNAPEGARIRKKGASSLLVEDLEWCDHLITCNSMAVMEAIHMGKMVTDTHGCFRNTGQYDYSQVRDYYEAKQYKLEDIRI